MNEQCGNCRFWKPQDDATINGRIGWCRRFPPQVVSETDGPINCTWPETIERDWCGEWKSFASGQVSGKPCP